MKLCHHHAVGRGTGAAQSAASSAAQQFADKTVRPLRSARVDGNLIIGSSGAISTNWPTATTNQAIITLVDEGATNKAANALPQGGSGTPRPAYPFGRFLTPTPRLIHISKSMAITTEDHIWEDPDGKQITLRRGFPTDGASLPWLFTIHWSPWEPKVLPAALFHDAGYSLRGTEYDLGPKAEIDRRFYLGMRVAGFRAKRIFWRSVQIAGWPSWWSPNNRYVDGYLYSMRNNCLDAWVESFRQIPGMEKPVC